MQVLKPDRVIMRMFQRLGLIENSGQLLKSVIVGRKLAEANELPIRYIDIVQVAYGQSQSTQFEIDKGICLNKPRCEICRVSSMCNYYKKGPSNDPKLNYAILCFNSTSSPSSSTSGLSKSREAKSSIVL